MSASFMPIMTSEIRHFREMQAEGLSYSEIARRTGRCASSVRHHLADGGGPGTLVERAERVILRRRAERLQRLIDLCNASVDLFYLECFRPLPPSFGESTPSSKQVAA